ncbi:MAG TPA: hypothetical protein VLI92_02875 [Candidatus Saccharimonadales bacterium]|nr:hypothetical protein [Candidatus Saccharimonadales bacterium]
MINSSSALALAGVVLILVGIALILHGRSKLRDAGTVQEHPQTLVHALLYFKVVPMQQSAQSKINLGIAVLLLGIILMASGIIISIL